MPKSKSAADKKSSQVTATASPMKELMEELRQVNLSEYDDVNDFLFPAFDRMMERVRERYSQSNPEGPAGV